MKFHAWKYLKGMLKRMGLSAMHSYPSHYLNYPQEGGFTIPFDVGIER